MAKGFSKSLKSPKFIEILYTLRVMLPSLTALSRTFQTGSRNFEKTKSKLQQILDERKPLKLLKTDLKNRLQRRNLKEDEQVEKTMHSMTERYKSYVMEYRRQISA